VAKEQFRKPLRCYIKLGDNAVAERWKWRKALRFSALLSRRACFRIIEP
jgi:hypothetical protein